MNGIPFPALTLTCFLLLVAYSTAAQQVRMSIHDLLGLVEKQRPDLKALQQQMMATGLESDLVKNTLTPEMTVGYQAGYGTYNNLTGMTYPGLMMPVSGPVAMTATHQMVAGSALALNVLWTPLTFGQRTAAAEKASARYRMATSAFDNALFQLRYAAILSYLDVLYLQWALRAQTANVERAKAGLGQSLVLAVNGLRPGLDTAQFKSLLAQATISYLNTRRSYTSSVLQLYRLAGMEGDPMSLVLMDTTLTVTVPKWPDTTTSLLEHPMIKYQEESIATGVASLKELQKAWRPKLEFWGNAYSRGSGVAPDGTIHATDGFMLQRGNYGAGAQLTFPILASGRINIQKKQFTSRILEERDRLAQVEMDLRNQASVAEEGLREQSLIAEQTPELTRSALLVFDGLQLSYQNGLTDFTSLAKGQEELLMAQMTEVGSRLAVWKALLEFGVAKGRISIFMDQLSK